MGLLATKGHEDASWRTPPACRVHTRVNALGWFEKRVRKSANTVR
jgi:hypothetical protein